MKKYLFIILSALFACALASCASLKNRSVKNGIVGHYEYEHSWNYASPDGVGFMHCDEVGRLDFNSDGTFVDVAVQKHSHCLPDSTQSHYSMEYHCEGEWKVENGKFLFCEHSENFSLKLLNEAPAVEESDFAAEIVKQNTPDSSRWFTFDIDRLDEEWFVWSYTDKRNRKTTWDMKKME